MIHQLNPSIDVHCPLGYGKTIAWIDYGPEVNIIWKVQFYTDGSVRNFFDDDIRVYPNPMNGEKIIIPKEWKK